MLYHVQMRTRLRFRFDFRTGRIIDRHLSHFPEQIASFWYIYASLAVQEVPQTFFAGFSEIDGLLSEN